MKEPADQQNPEIRGESRYQRTSAVDKQTDNICPLHAPPIAKLAANEHEGSHDERVDRDRRLQPEHRRVQVGDNLRDRHVHDRRVKNHDELCGREHHDDAPTHLFALVSV